MAELPMVPTTMALAERATDLSSELHTLLEPCPWAQENVESVGSEIAMLGVTLWQLHEAMTEDPARYTQSFSRDLAEISLELHLVFEEITTCFNELRKSECSSGNVLGWLFKKTKGHNLIKHLVALKTTLIVMRTVLQHGKEHGNQTTSAFKPYHPALYGDRAILDTVFSTNRNAIIAFQDLDEINNGRDSGEKHEQGSSEPQQSGLHSRPEGHPMASRKPDATIDSTERQSFSRRGMRLGVHMAILNMGAHSAPDELKDKWIETCRAHTSTRNATPGKIYKENDHDKSILQEIPKNTDRRTVGDFDPAEPDRQKIGHRHQNPSISKKLHKMMDRLHITRPSGETRGSHAQ